MAEGGVMAVALRTQSVFRWTPIGWVFVCFRNRVWSHGEGWRVTDFGHVEPGS